MIVPQVLALAPLVPVLRAIHLAHLLAHHHSALAVVVVLSLAHHVLLRLAQAHVLVVSQVRHAPVHLVQAPALPVFLQVPVHLVSHQVHARVVLVAALSVQAVVPHLSAHRAPHHHSRRPQAAHHHLAVVLVVQAFHPVLARAHSVRLALAVVRSLQVRAHRLSVVLAAQAHSVHRVVLPVSLHLHAPVASVLRHAHHRSVVLVAHRLSVAAHAVHHLAVRLALAVLARVLARQVSHIQVVVLVSHLRAVHHHLVALVRRCHSH